MPAADTASRVAVSAATTQIDQVPASDVDTPSDVGFSTKLGIAIGIFLLVLGTYALTAPGRIDSIDGQARFDVSYNWLVTGRPIVRDNWIAPFMSVPGRDGLRYSYYGPPASVLGIPLVWLGLHGEAPSIPKSHFLFSLESSILGAAIAVVLFLFYLELGVTIRKAVLWALISAFATMIWPASNSTLDNAQHAFFAVSALFLGFLAARRKSVAYAAAGGLMAGVLFLYQEYFLLIIPALALSTLDWPSTLPVEVSHSATLRGRSVLAKMVTAVKQAFRAVNFLVRDAWEGPGESRSSCIRYCVFLAAICVGIGLSLAYNNLRFGSWFDDGKFHVTVYGPVSQFGNPLAGFLSLLVSPGKSVFLYSPLLALGFFGAGELWRRWPELLAAITASSIALVLFLSCVAYCGGDWCWGPRYLAPLLPLWALAFPFVDKTKLRRGLVIGLITAAFLVQLLALSVENERFFFERGFKDFFWADNPWVYFKHSALFARVGEAFSLTEGIPSTARFFNSIPVPTWTTYAPLGPPGNVPRVLADAWIRNFQMYFLPRPWPLWMSSIPAAQCPINARTWELGFLCLILVGFGLIFRCLRVKGNYD